MPSRFKFLPVVLVIGGLVAAVVIVFSRDNSPAPIADVDLAASDSGPIHVHGLGINPEDG